MLAIADTVAFLELGRITLDGPRAEVDEERLAAAYLGEVAHVHDEPATDTAPTDPDTTPDGRGPVLAKP